ncbi:MAG: hypothetical protein KC549_18350, partial [Myxococcales bacterium]|nr:hypothetical protein [Myxococcales bacterium]
MRGVTLSVCLLGCSTATPPGPAPAVVLGGCGAVWPGASGLLCVDPHDAVAFVPLAADERLAAPAPSE